MQPQSLLRILLSSSALAALGGVAGAQLQPDWITALPAGNALASGYQDLVVDAAGNSYVTGITGSGSDTDVLTAALDPAGDPLWQATFDGPQGGLDQGRAIALAPDGSVWVAGNTPDPSFFSDVLLLHYDGTTGALLDTVDYTSGAFTSEGALDLVIDATGDLFVLGTTVGDGTDVLVLSFDAAGVLRWRQTWDGAAFGPFSQDAPVEAGLDSSGHLLALVNGIGGSSQPDYVVIQYDLADGKERWVTSWNQNGAESPAAMAIDAAGDVYVTGTAIAFTNQIGTIKLQGSDGSLLWDEFDAGGLDDHGVAIALDGLGGVYVTGSVDPDGDQSNFNDDFYTVRRDAATGALTWTHRYGDACVGCFDVPSDVLVDPAGFVYVAGVTSSAPYSNAQISFVLDAATGLELDRGVVLPSQGVFPGSGDLLFDGARNWINASRSSNPNTGQVQITVLEYAAFSSSCGTEASATVVTDAGGLNVPGGLDAFPAGSVPSIGNAGFAVAVDDPGDVCGIAPGTGTFVVIAAAPASFVLPGLGCAAGGPGEVMVLPTPSSLVFGPVAWPGAGQPAVHLVPIPADTTLCGLAAYAQALFLDSQAPAGDRVTVTNRLDLVLGD